MAFNRKQKLRDNIEAIRTAFILDRENRTATTEERAILQRYCGFGGLKCILNPAKELTDAVRWAKSDLELFAPTVELHRLIRENSKDETEYKRFVDSLKASVLTAFYTPKEITDTIADVLADYSVRPARMLEPSAGVGVFVDSMLRHSPNADVMAFEKDLLTGTILRHLYPDQKMRTCGFEKIERPFNNYFDLAVSNIPFGDIAVFDAEFQRSDSFGRRSAQKTIHNYFFLKGLDAVRDGGIVAFITSQGVLNSTKTSVRNELFSQANLVSAIRLPNNLFTDNAGTEVGSDLIVLQKNLSKKEMSQDERLMTVIQTDTKTALTDNAYFIHHPERIVHTMAKLDTDPYGKPAMVYLHEGKAAGIAGDLRRMLDEDFHYRLAMRLYSGSIRQAGTEEKVAVQNKVERPAIKLETVSSAQTVETPTEKPQPADEKPEIEPRPQYSAGVQLTLLDLWGMTEEVSQPKTSKKKKTVKKAVTAKSTPPKPKVTVTPTAPTAKPAMENKEVKAENTAKPADPDDIYATLDWDTNPPINGFYEMMMDLTPERRAELRQVAARHGEEQQKEIEAPQEAGQSEPAQETSAAASMLFPEPEKEQQQIEKEPDLSPCPYHRTPEMHLREGSLVADRAHDNIGYLKDITPYGATFQPLGLTGYQKEKALLYVSLRDAYERLYRYESLRREENVPWREHLNTCYDEFVMRYGNLNARQNVKLVMMDAGGRDILSLERAEEGKFVKADIFEHPVSFSVESLVNAGSPEEALSASLNKYGGVNLEYMRTITDGTEEELLTALKDRIYFNPLADGYEIKDRFIAGNVIEKAERIEAWMNGNPDSGRMPDVKESLEALRNAEPRRITFEELDFNFGERWIPTGVYSAYMSHLYETDVRIGYSTSLDEFSVSCGHRSMKITDEFLVKGHYRHYDGMHLLKHALHNTCPDMMKPTGQKDEHGNDIKVRDSEGIQLANAKIDEIRNGFSEWLEEQSPQFKERLTTMYNRKFNCYVRPKYDGSHQTFPDLNLKGLASRGVKSIYPSQKDCVWMLKQNGGGICDHQVGTGKTLIMCMAA
ncbi:N-6 DNA methylase, partial [Bacteroides cellulosilyticus]|uniref:N-6 DNA methylase n=1 Tax=Bacteroides cellulosilyticus TaxID=246787 RepID=UPI0039782F3C